MSNTETRLLFVHALSPLHAGTGQSLGAVDLAIARDRATGMPLLPGSGIKGALRAKARLQDRKDVVAIFGPETANASEHAGSAVFGDANLLLLPVRSVAGTYAWVTSPHLLLRLQRDCDELGSGLGLSPGLFPAFPASIGKCGVCTGSGLVLDHGGKKVVLEDLDLEPEHKELETLATRLGRLVFGDEAPWIEAMKRRFCVLHDDVMGYLAQYATDVATRVKLDAESKTVEDGALWTEESLPTETILVSLVLAMPAERAKMSAQDVATALETVCAGSTQLGGKHTVGRGRCALRLVEKGAIR